MTATYRPARMEDVPAVLALERVGPQRFLSTLRTAGVAPGLPPGGSSETQTLQEVVDLRLVRHRVGGALTLTKLQRQTATN